MEMMEMMVHELKVWPSFFRALLDGSKTFEVREHDRDYAPGNLLILEEWDPTTQTYTGRTTERIVGYVLYGGRFGISPDYVVLSLLPAPTTERDRE